MTKRSKFYDVSIVISVTDYHWAHAAQNVILTRRQNPNIDIQWILVANNHSPDFPIPESVTRNPSVQVVDGFPFSQFQDAPRPGSASLAAGMRRGFENVRSRYAIQMDSDFYAIRFGWIETVLEEMKRRDLAFWGVPWDIKRKEKWRGFPCSHLTVFDTDKISLEEIDFEPRYLPYFEYFEVPRVLRNNLYVEFLKRDFATRTENVKLLNEQRDTAAEKLARLPKIHTDDSFRDRENVDADLSAYRDPIRRRSTAKDVRPWAMYADIRHNWGVKHKHSNLKDAKVVAEILFDRDVRNKVGAFSPKRSLENQVLRFEQRLEAQESMLAQTTDAIADISAKIDTGEWKGRFANVVLGLVQKAPKTLQDRFWAFYEYNLVNRSQIGKTGDLNIEIKDLAVKRGWKADTCQISLRPTEFGYVKTLPDDKKRRFWFRYYFEQMLPVSWSLIPMRHASVTTKRFKDLGLPDFRDLGWEEYFWKGEPFAVHIRSTARKTGKAQENIQELWLRNFLELAVGRPIEQRNMLDTERPVQNWAPAGKVPASIAQSDSQELRQYKNCEAGKRIFVVANGPSLTPADLDLIKHEVSIACNKTWLLYDQTDWRPNYYFSEDTMVIKQNAEQISKLRGSIKFFPQSTLKQGIGLVPSERPFSGCHYYPFEIPNWKQGIPEGNELFSQDVSEVVYGGGTVLYSMFQFANYFGSKEIYLIGCDHNFQTTREDPMVWLDLEVGSSLNSTELDLFLKRNGHREVTRKDAYFPELRYPGDYLRKKDRIIVFLRLRKTVVEVKFSDDGYVQWIAILENGGRNKYFCRSYTIGGVEVISRGSDNHFAKGYRQAGEKWGLPNMWLTTNLIAKAGRSIEMNGGKLVNATRGGALDVLPRADLETLFREHA